MNAIAMINDILKTIRNSYSKRIVSDLYHYLRAQKQVTKVLGRQYTRNQEYVELDITYRCNLKCPNCNRSCPQAPSKEEMTVEQVQSFISESIANHMKWKLIHVLGGEPTVHKSHLEILELLMQYKKKHNPHVRIELVTNGFGKKVEKNLANIPKEIEILNSNKDSNPPLFFPFHMAPQDSRFYKNVDYTAGCWIMGGHCGMGVTPLGYYPCAIMGGIDRVFGLGIGREQLPSSDDLMLDQLKIGCRLCGHFKVSFPTNKQKTSRSWETALNLYKKKKQTHPLETVNQIV